MLCCSLFKRNSLFLLKVSHGRMSKKVAKQKASFSREFVEKQRAFFNKIESIIKCSKSQSKQSNYHLSLSQVFFPMNFFSNNRSANQNDE